MPTISDILYFIISNILFLNRLNIRWVDNISNRMSSYIEEDMRRDILVAHPRLLNNVNGDLLNNIITNHPECLASLEPRLQIEIIRDHLYLLPYASDEVKCNRERVLTFVKQNYGTLRHVGEHFLNDKGIVIEAVKKNAMYLEYGSFDVQKAILCENPHLQDRLDLVRVLFRRHFAILNYTSSKVQKVILEDQPERIKYLQRHCQKELLMQKPLWLEYVSNEISSNREIVMGAVQRDALALQYANDDFKSDEELVKIAVTKNHTSLSYAHPELIKRIFLERPFLYQNTLLLTLVVNKHPEVINSLPLYVQKNYVIKVNVGILSHLPASSQRQIILEHPTMLKYTSYDAHEQILLSICLSPENDPEAPKQLAKIFPYLSPDIRSNENLMLSALSVYGDALQFVANDLKSNKELVMSTVRKSGQSIRYANDELRQDQDVVLAALKSDINILSSKMNITVKSDTLKTLIEQIRNNPQILNKVAGNLFKDVTNINITRNQNLLRESMISKIFFKEKGLYLRVILLLRKLDKLFIPNDCLNLILSFVFKKYDVEKISFVCQTSAPVEKAAFAALEPEIVDVYKGASNEEKEPLVKPYS